MPLVDVNRILTLPGIVNIVQVACGFAALFASSFVWRDTDTFFQFIYKGFGWQTLIVFILLITWIFAIAMLLNNLTGRDVQETVGKRRLLIVYGICLVLLIISASLESWYCDKSKGHFYHARFVAVTIFNWILVASYIALIALTMFFA
ncbi:unnamed protein product, partial [Mesorhabditis belari]|uniref:MARVEL domain-containing protein n=1 Tax=Mesorhabditis belari TaxID=2138241 RepID=A0AAF3JB21_9BILA